MRRIAREFHRCVEGMAPAHFHRDDGGSYGRVDARVTQACFVGLQVGLRLIKLGHQVVDLGAADANVASAVCRSSARMAPSALICFCRASCWPASRCWAGWSASRARSPPATLALHRPWRFARWVDLHEQIALLHLGAGLRVQTVDLARDLRADVDVAARLLGADGGDGGLDIAARSDGGLAFSAGSDAPPQTCHACSLAGLGLIQIPAFDVQEHMQRGELVEVLANWPPPPVPMQIVYPHRRLQSRRVQVFSDWLTELIARSLNKSKHPLEVATLMLSMQSRSRVFRAAPMSRRSLCQREKCCSAS